MKIFKDIFAVKKFDTPTKIIEAINIEQPELTASINQDHNNDVSNPQRQLANTIIQWVFFQLVQEIRSLGLDRTPRELPEPTQSHLIQAQFGAISEVRSVFDDLIWIEDWEGNGKAWALQMVLGENEISRATVELQRFSTLGKNDLAQFTLCGILAARSLTESLNKGISAEQWLESYPGTYASTTRLFSHTT